MCCMGPVISVVSDGNSPESFSFSLVGVWQQQFRLAGVFNVLGEEEVAPEERSQKKG